MTTIIPKFEIGQKVRSKQDAPYSAPRTILHIDGNVAMIRDPWGTSKLYKLADLVCAEPPKPEPFKPGWYRVKHKPASNFIYYIPEQLGSKLVYTAGYNPQTGEMDGSPGYPVLIGKILLDVGAGDLIRQKFVDA